MKHQKRIIFHIDVNSAFLSWEAIEQLRKGSNTDLRTIPSVVGGDPEKRHGIVLAKSIPAKKYGIVTGEPIFQALRKCPSLTIVPPSHNVYAEQSRALTDLLLSYTPDIEKFSIDECFIDISGLRLLYGDDYMKLAREIKARIRNELGFTVNIGISGNKLLAKMASDFKKPDMIHTLFPDEIEEKMWPLPVSELFMVGKASTERFERMGIKTIGDLANAKPDLLEHHFKKYGCMIWEYANGLDDSPVQSKEADAKDISNEITIDFDITDKETARLYILSLSETIGMRLRKAGLYAGVIAVNIKNNQFQSYSKQRKVENATQDTNEIFSVAAELFDKVWKREPVRLLGVAASQLQRDPPVQFCMFDPMNKSCQTKANLNDSIDKIREKYGNDYVIRGSLLNLEKNRRLNK